MPGTDGFPAKFHTLYPHQRAAIEEISEAFRLGANVVVLDAPTGSGKTVIAEAVRQNLAYTGTYICTTKSLQDQFANDFNYAAVLKGRSNYPTMREDLFNDRDYGVTAADCTKRDTADGQRCDWCVNISQCPYEQAKSRALSANLSVLNTTYYLTECNGPGRFSGRTLAICDEADLLESELMRYCGFEISPRRMDQLGLKEPKHVTKEESWVNWIQESVQVVQEAVKRVRVEQPQLWNESDKGILRQTRQRQSLVRLHDSLKRLARDLTTKETDWIYTGRNGRVSFKPITVDTLTQKMLWQHSTKFLLMSATIISPSQLVQQDLGYDGNWYSVSVPSTFPPKNRPVKYVPVARVSQKKNTSENEDGIYEQLARGIEEIIARHPGERVLVHTVSYDLTRLLKQKLETSGGLAIRLYDYGSSAGRDEAIREFTSGPFTPTSNISTRTQPTGQSVLLAPSLDRGIDLPDDQCRVIIIAKVPYPYLGDRQVSARLHKYGGRQWYLVQTIRSIVQMAGRGMRHSNDTCTTYILDSDFNRTWNEGRRFYPEWFKQAMIWTDRLQVSTAGSPANQHKKSNLIDGSKSPLNVVHQTKE